MASCGVGERNDRPRGRRATRRRGRGGRRASERRRRTPALQLKRAATVSRERAGFQVHGWECPPP
eukprot:scaffold193887_cov30-Tisochrysis_lutea.AAC.4